MNINRFKIFPLAGVLAFYALPALAQDESSMMHMDHGDMPVSNDAEMKSEDMDSTTLDNSGMNHSMSHHHTDMENESIMTESATAGFRNPHAYADGYDFGPIPRPHMADEKNFGSLLVDRLEYIHNDDSEWLSYDLEAWYGDDYDRLVLKAEGDADNGELDDAETELLWRHAVSAFWNSEIGIRHDSGETPNRNWLAFGVQGLAPYWVELDATAYLGESGHSALAVEAEYELLLTQRLILQPRLEVNFYGKDDPEYALGSGLSDVTAGIRLRYEIQREFSPYIGIEWVRLFGGTADYARIADQDVANTQAVAGLRFWF